MIARVLRKGVQGDDVVEWQNFLIGYLNMMQGEGSHEDLVADGDFGAITESHTKIFQKNFGLIADGIVGRGTLVTALQTGFGLLEDDAPAVLDRTNPLWPSNIYGLEPLSVIDKMETFGTFSYKSAPIAGCPEAVSITNAKNFKIDWVDLPWIAGKPGAPKNGKIQFNAKCTGQLVALFNDWESAGLVDRVLTWGGSYVPRFVRGSRVTLSSHAWGTAFDINVAWNMLGSQPALVGKEGCVRELVDIANNHGWFWGGHFKRLDGMHFEVCKIQ